MGTGQGSIQLQLLTIFPQQLIIKNLRYSNKAVRYRNYSNRTFNAEYDIKMAVKFKTTLKSLVPEY